jgi:hypothetical protein
MRKFKKSKIIYIRIPKTFFNQEKQKGENDISDEKSEISPHEIHTERYTTPLCKSIKNHLVNKQFSAYDSVRVVFE